MGQFNGFWWSPDECASRVCSRSRLQARDLYDCTKIASILGTMTYICWVMANFVLKFSHFRYQLTVVGRLLMSSSRLMLSGICVVTTEALKAPRWDAEGVEGKGMGMGCPPPQPTRGLGNVISSPSGVQRPKTSFGLFRAWKNTPDSHKSVIFDIFASYI